MMAMMQKALLTSFVAALLVGGVGATGVDPTDLIVSAFTTVTHALASTQH